MNKHIGLYLTAALAFGVIAFSVWNPFGYVGERQRAAEFKELEQRVQILERKVGEIK